jgi:hypothetical protein
MVSIIILFVSCLFIRLFDMTRCFMLCTIDDFFTTIRLIRAGVCMEILSIARTGPDWSIMA